MERVIIVGIGGKSTLAARLGKQLKLPVYHLDKYYWLANWRERDREEMKQMVDKIANKNRWIIEGNFGMKDDWIDKRLTQADTIIFLNYPFYRTVVPRMLKRRWQYRGKSRPDIAPNNPEKLNWEFIKYLKSFDRQKYLSKIKKYQNAKVHIFNHPKEAERFIKTL